MVVNFCFVFGVFYHNWLEKSQVSLGGRQCREVGPETGWLRRGTKTLFSDLLRGVFSWSRGFQTQPDHPNAGFVSVGSAGRAKPSILLGKPTQFKHTLRHPVWRRPARTQPRHTQPKHIQPATRRHRVPAGSSPILVRPAGRRVVQGCRHQAARGEDTSVKQLPAPHHPRGARPPVRLATPAAERQPTCEPLPPHSASQPVSHASSRPRHLASCVEASGLAWAWRTRPGAAGGQSAQRMGGLALGSASRGAAAAYRHLGQTLPMISERNPAVADQVEHAMTHEVPHEGCLVELHNAGGRWDREATHLVRVAPWQATSRQRLE